MRAPCPPARWLLGQGLVATDASFTVAAWVRLDRLDGEQVFVSQDGKSVSGFAPEKRADGRFALTRPVAGGSGCTPLSGLPPGRGSC